MRRFLFNVIFSISLTSLLSANEFTISSYNCGGLTEHYDYMRAAVMQKLMQERYNAEPEAMARVEKIQQVALKILFATDPIEKQAAEQIWQKNGYQKFLEEITMIPTIEGSPNRIWYEKVEKMLSSYKVRPVVLVDQEVREMIGEHVKDLSCQKCFPERLTETRHLMAKRIFAHQLKYDIICLQEATYLDATMFPSQYQVVFGGNDHSINGVAWNTERFELLEEIGNIKDKGFAVKLLDKESGKTVLIASGHLTGCDPFNANLDTKTNTLDSAKGDEELTSICALFEALEADIKLIGMDSNVTSTHPRLKIVKEFDYKLDYENYLEQTCSNPYQVLNTRIDWIAAKANTKITITNIPVLGVGLNSIQSNMSDHKPIAAKIQY